jgi:uncharacterized protein YndB with AHSA1/START domain
MTNVAADKLAGQIAAIHSTFRIERSYPQPPARVFRAFAEKEIVRRWRVEDENCRIHEFTFDFRVGGAEVSRFSFAGGPEIRLDAQFQDILSNQRIVYCYRMATAEGPFSASLATVELVPSGGGTHLTYTEQGAYFDGPDSAVGREAGCRELLEKLAAELRR